MRALLTFERDDRCEHDPNRECTACFKKATVPHFGGQDDFDRAWRERALPVEDALAEDVVESFTVTVFVG